MACVDISAAESVMTYMSPKVTSDFKDQWESKNKVLWVPLEKITQVPIMMSVFSRTLEKIVLNYFMSPDFLCRDCVKTHF